MVQENTKQNRATVTGGLWPFSRIFLVPQQLIPNHQNQKMFRSQQANMFKLYYLMQAEHAWNNQQTPLNSTGQ